MSSSKRRSSRPCINDVPLDALPELIQQLEDKMKAAAKNLEFEEAANLRDRIKGLRQKLVGRG
jgi:excinuclease ABC subunit B